VLQEDLDNNKRDGDRDEDLDGNKRDGVADVESPRRPEGVADVSDGWHVEKRVRQTLMCFATCFKKILITTNVMATETKILMATNVTAGETWAPVRSW
jgi:hypothetical protein